MCSEDKTKENEAKGPHNSRNTMQQLEEAMRHCKFGRFHWRLLSASLAACFANNILTSNSSFLLPSAECDLQMNLMQKGFLNATPFIGMMVSGIFAGILTDAFGRRKFLIGGYLGVFFCCLVEGSSQTYTMLVVGKLLEGICLTIGFNPNMAIVSELTNIDVRDRVLMFFSTFKGIAVIGVVTISWVVLIQDWYIVVIENIFELHAWSFYLYICGLWSLLASIQYYYLPESPKFLMAHGKNEQALEILKDIYAENTGNPRDDFPVKSFAVQIPVEIKTSSSVSINNRLSGALMDIKSLFRRDLLGKLTSFFVTYLLTMLAYNMLRLWYPQISTMIENYTNIHNDTNYLCLMIEGSMNVSRLQEDLPGVIVEECITHPSGSQTYINGIIMGLVCLLCHVISGIFIGKLSQRTLIFLYLMICSFSSLGLYWSYTGTQVLMLVATVVGFTQATGSLLFTMVVRAFPTTVRTLSVAIITMGGRIGSSTGNLLFPYMLEHNCMMSFVSVSIITLCVAFLVFLLPNPSKENKDTGDG